jgi:hypothetical protein
LVERLRARWKEQGRQGEPRFDNWYLQPNRSTGSLPGYLTANLATTGAANTARSATVTLPQTPSRPATPQVRRGGPVVLRVMLDGSTSVDP